ncbi:MAG TPA: D-glucuronyl C5-epimerase family protein [Gaiellaceae bacterium]|nr:D-glucuronyl C5-epimerase family protein [Gaiellaceae bacterium]
MLRKGILVAAVAALFSAPPASADVRSDSLQIRRGLERAVDAGRLTRSEAGAHRVTLRRARAVFTLLPGARARELAGVLHDVALQWRRYNRPRSLALFSMLDANADFLSVHNVPRERSDIVAGDGVVYRLFAGHGFQFHPLGNFAALNSHVTDGRDAAAATLASSLVARGVRQDGARVWEYYFAFGGGRPPWTSGMAQAVAAQALARAGRRLDDRSALGAAAGAYRAVPLGLLLGLATGPWIQHYDFSRLVVLNAHLQSVLSIWAYAEIAADSGATALGDRMEASAKSLFPRFDTGYWSRYSLGNDSDLHYHQYVVSLLNTLARRTADEFWAGKAARFQLYLEQPPLFRVGRVPTLYPVPAEGFRDVARVAYWVSKPSRVVVTVGGQRFSGAVGGGWHRFVWQPGRRPAGDYAVRISAVDLAGNRATQDLTTIELKRDREPPQLSGTLAGRRLSWKAVDPATPWLRLTLVLERPDERKRVDLGRRPLSGAITLQRLGLRWEATLVAADSSGNRARIDLGPFGGRG